ncbi:MAG: hypothetical protein NC033_00110 [Clostridiales bacterium]|nr:hypothetical protein [Clostridiales bacterium]
MQETEILGNEQVEQVESVEKAETVESIEQNNQPTEPSKPSVGKRIGASVKEWFRKFIVKLKRRPTNIGLFVLAISTIVILCCLGNISQLGLEPRYQEEMQGLCIFVDVLFGILVLLLYMNSFPKRSKHPKWVMYALTIVFMVILIGLDIYLYVIWGINRAADLKGNPSTVYLTKLNGFYFSAINGVLAHAILVIISLLLMVLSPVIGKLLNKINTKVDLEETQLKDQIDVEEDD